MILQIIGDYLARLRQQAVQCYADLPETQAQDQELHDG